MPYYKRGQRSEHVAKLHGERMDKPLALLRAEQEQAEKAYNNVGEPEVVFGAQLAAILQTWRENWLADRLNDPATAQYDQQDISTRVMGPLDWLKEMTGLHIRRIHGLMKGEFKHVSISTADLVLTVIDQNQLLSNGTITVFPNPNWTPEKWIEYMETRGCI